ncbi:hypothetical protein, partial [Mesorhizobium sp.]|uniref:hypothetical protein n=1 Tax=Mesorhizobium sp. TaxID=1871066 RepID=UPI0025800592
TDCIWILCCVSREALNSQSAGRVALDQAFSCAAPVTLDPTRHVRQSLTVFALCAFSVQMRSGKSTWRTGSGYDYIEIMHFPTAFTPFSLWRNQPLSAIACLVHIVNI